jgi:hypothetical protein
MCSYTAAMATYALAGAPLLPGAPPVNGLTEPGLRSRPSPGPLPVERFLPVHAELARLFPGGGIPKGGTVLLGQGGPPLAAVPDPPSRSAPGTSRCPPGLTSLLLMLVAGASAGGHWCAVVGLPELGLAAAAEMGADLGRLVLVPKPGPHGRWQSVVTTLLETVDLVCLSPDAPVRPTDARRLSARARERRSTLLVLDTSGPAGLPRGLGVGLPGRAPSRWPAPCDLRCAVRDSSWSGLGSGHGLLRSRQLEAEVGGRGAASRPRRGQIRLPA